MNFEFNREPVEVKTKQGVRKFYLEEHTNEEFDLHLEKSGVTFDRAIDRLQQISKEIAKGANPDPEELQVLKKACSEVSADIVSGLLHPEDNLPAVNGSWVRANLSWRMREQIILKQNELDGVETVRDQSFLVETALIKNYLSIKLNLKRIQDIKSNSTTESENSPASTPEMGPKSDHVSVDDLEIDDDGLPLA